VHQWCLVYWNNCTISSKCMGLPGCQERVQLPTTEQQWQLQQCEASPERNTVAKAHRVIEFIAVLLRLTEVLNSSTCSCFCCDRMFSQRKGQKRYSLRAKTNLLLAGCRCVGDLLHRCGVLCLFQQPVATTGGPGSSEPTHSRNGFVTQRHWSRNCRTTAPAV
jgi:hypothetical protein